MLSIDALFPALSQGTSRTLQQIPGLIPLKPWGIWEKHRRHVEIAGSAKPFLGQMWPKVSPVLSEARQQLPRPVGRLTPAAVTGYRHRELLGTPELSLLGRSWLLGHGGNSMSTRAEHVRQEEGKGEQSLPANSCLPAPSSGQPWLRGFSRVPASIPNPYPLSPSMCQGKNALGSFSDIIQAIIALGSWKQMLEARLSHN